jgi:hypothetical protein
MFSIPQFPLIFDFWTCTGAGFAADTAAPIRITSPANLAWGRRVNVASTGGTGSAGILTACMTLLLPALTDVRGPADAAAAADPLTGFSGDICGFLANGVPRYYQVVMVDDVGKGFANEHRAAIIFAFPGTWASPYG